MKKIISTFSLLLIATIAFCQQDSSKQSVRFPFGTYHKNNRTINGISYGVWSQSFYPRNTNTNGIRLEIAGEGILTPMIPQSPVPETDVAYREIMNTPQSEKIRGLNISATGSVCDCTVSGISVGSFGQILTRVNGISASSFTNIIQQSNGMQFALFSNDAYVMKGMQAAFLFNSSEKMYGLQLGLFNQSKRTRGIQIGLWNKNEKRKMPFINWNFKS